MEFVEAMGIVNRMCTTTNSCDECPINEKIEDSAFSCMGFFMRCPEQAEEILTKWNAEHPVKTLKDVFDDMFPDVCRLDSGVPDVCVRSLGYERCVARNDCNTKNCIKCWNQEYKEPKK